METNNPSMEDKNVPSKEMIIAMIRDQIEVKAAQVELQKLNTEFAQLRLEELKSLAIAAQITNPQPAQGSSYEGGVPHKITQEDLDNNPELSEQGLKVGDEVIVSMNEEEEAPAPAPKKEDSKRGLKKV
jgi:hypothetical protein